MAACNVGHTSCVTVRLRAVPKPNGTDPQAPQARAAWDTMSGSGFRCPYAVHRPHLVEPLVGRQATGPSPAMDEMSAAVGCNQLHDGGQAGQSQRPQVAAPAAVARVSPADPGVAAQRENTKKSILNCLADDKKGYVVVKLSRPHCAQ